MNPLVAKARADIERVGWSAVGVGAGPDSETFTYTAGLTAQGHHELIIVGLDPYVAHGILAAAVQELQAGVRFSDGALVTGVLVDYTAKLVACGNEHLTMARSIYGSEVMALQIVWPDTDGRYPGDPGYDAVLPDQKL